MGTSPGVRLDRSLDAGACPDRARDSVTRDGCTADAAALVALGRSADSPPGSRARHLVDRGLASIGDHDGTPVLSAPESDRAERRVVIWRDVLLPPSETFIINQAAALTAWTPRLAGLRSDSRTTLPVDPLLSCSRRSGAPATAPIAGCSTAGCCGSGG